MNPFWIATRTALFRLDPETAHDLSLRALETGLVPYAGGQPKPALVQTIAGITFPNPIGMAAGYDKNARVYNALFRMGFGFVEIGTVTPKPQPGNPRPRAFRLVAERALINRFGFNSEGHDAVRRRIEHQPPTGVLGINIGANKASTDPIPDYCEGVRVFAPLASYLTVNISSPNTPGLRDLQAPNRLNALLDAVMATRERASRRVPIFVKLSPDLHDDDMGAIIESLLSHKVDGLILTNTTIARDTVRFNPRHREAGGLSGAPLRNRSTSTLVKFAAILQGKLLLIGVGGIESGEAALEKIRAGACLVQLYTGLIYHGPGLVHDIQNAIFEDTKRNPLPFYIKV